MKLRSLAALVILFSLIPACVQAKPTATVGAAAPEFTLTDATGTTHNLKDFKGKLVVLEWINHSCPFVKKHYSKGDMQALQEKYTAEGVVWLSINSSAPGKQGHTSPEEAKQLVMDMDAHPTAVLLDADGTVGELYGAKTTPHMFIIGTEGTLEYAGAIDSINSTDPADVAKATNYVAGNLDKLLAGTEPDPKATAPYGCSVKY